MIKVQALLFDLDGTLIDSKKDLTLSVRWLQRELGVRESSEAEVATFIGDGVVKLVHRAIPTLAGDSLAQAVARFKDHYRIHCLDNTKAYPFVKELLFQFRRKPMAVVTNKPLRASRRILEGLGLLSRFRLVLGGDSLRTKKPDPAPLRFALATLGVANPRRAVMVGDGRADVLAGQAAGVWTAGIRSNIGRGNDLNASKPDFYFHHLTELLHRVS